MFREPCVCRKTGLEDIHEGMLPLPARAAHCMNSQFAPHASQAGLPAALARAVENPEVCCKKCLHDSCGPRLCNLLRRPSRHQASFSRCFCSGKRQIMDWCAPNSLAASRTRHPLALQWQAGPQQLQNRIAWDELSWRSTCPRQNTMPARLLLYAQVVFRHHMTRRLPSQTWLFS